MSHQMPIFRVTTETKTKRPSPDRQHFLLFLNSFTFPLSLIYECHRRSPIPQYDFPRRMIRVDRESPLRGIAIVDGFRAP